MDTKALRQKVLDLAIRGKLVPQDPNDEPASVLLERIRKEKQQMVKDGKLKAKDLKGDSVIFKDEDNLHYEKMPDGTVKCIENEIPFEVPAGWAWTRVADVTQFISDGDHQPPPQATSGVPFLVISDVNTGVINFSKCRFVENNYYDSLPTTRKAQAGDILFTVTGSYGIPVEVRTNKSFCFQRHIALLRPLIVMSEMITFVLKSDFVMDLCHCTATGIAQKTVGLNSIRGFLMPLPPYCEQQRLVNAISLAFAQIDLLETEKADLKTIITQAKSKILDLAIRGKLVPQDPSDEPASVLLERIRAEKEELVKQGKIKREKSESFIFRGDDKSYYQTLEQNSIKIDEPFLLPPNWIWVSHNELFNVSGGAQPPKDTFVFAPRSNYIRLFQIRDYGKKPEPVYIHESKATKRTVEGDIILARYGASLGKVFIAKEGAYNVAMAKVEKQFCVDVNNMFIYYYYLSSLYQGILSSFSRTAQAGFNKGDLRDLLFPLPPINEQHRIATAIETAFEQLDTIMNTLA